MEHGVMVGDGSPLQVAWRRGESWRDLTCEVRSRPVTVVTENGTSRVLDGPGGWQMRVPTWHPMRFDRDRQVLSEVVFASPCGVHTLSAGWPHWTTRVKVVLDGVWPHWATSESGAAQLAALSVEDPLVGHPSVACPVPYCPLADR